MIKSTKKAFYATVGAPVLTARRVNEKFQEITSRIRETDLTAEFNAWAAEGEKLLDRFGPTIEEWSARLDDTDVPAQVSKLREQLDDMVANWRQNFRPSEKAVTVPVKEEAPAKTTAKNPAAKPTAKQTAPKKSATKKPSAKVSASAKKSAAKKPAAKATKKA